MTQHQRARGGVLGARPGRPGHPQRRRSDRSTPGSSAAPGGAAPLSAGRRGPRPSRRSATGRSTSGAADHRRGLPQALRREGVVGLAQAGRRRLHLGGRCRRPIRRPDRRCSPYAGRAAAIYERTVTATRERRGLGPAVGGRSGRLGRSATRRPAAAIVAASRRQRRLRPAAARPETLALGLKINSDPDVVTRPDGSWLSSAAARSGKLSYYDARPGGSRSSSLGGAVR